MHVYIIAILCRATYHNSLSRTTGGNQKLVDIAVSHNITLKSYMYLCIYNIYTNIIGTTVYPKIY